MFPPPPARSQYSVLIRVRVRVTKLVEPVLVLKPFLVSRVDLPGLAAAASSSKQQQAASKQQHARNGEKSELRRGASDSGEILVDDTYGGEVQSHKV